MKTKMKTKMKTIMKTKMKTKMKTITKATLCVENIQSVLAQIGATLKDIAYTRVLVATQDRDDLVEAWHAYEAFMGEHDAPSTLHGVTVLGYPNQKVEIEVVVTIK